MKKYRSIIAGVFFIIAISHGADICEVFLDEYTIESGRQAYRIDVKDERGNYKGNYLRVKFSGDTKGLLSDGLAVYPADPNSYLVVNAVPDPNRMFDPNDPKDVADPNRVDRLEGSFVIGKSWQPGKHEIRFIVIDSHENPSDKYCVNVIAEDRTKPDAFGCTPAEYPF